MSLLLFFLPFLAIGFTAGQRLATPCAQDQGPIDFCQQDGKLVIHSPSHTRRFVIARVNDSTISDIQRIEGKSFDQRRVPPVADFDKDSTCLITSDRIDLSRVSDVSDRGLLDNTWYVVCAEFDTNTSDRRLAEHLRNISLAQWAMSDRAVNLSTAEGSHGGTCSRCTVISPSANIKFASGIWNRDKPRLVVRDEAPFASVTISGRINDEHESRRVFEFNRTLKPDNSINTVEVSVPTEFGRHSLAADVIPLAKNGSGLVIDGVPLVLYDYVGAAKFDGNAPTPGCTHFCCSHTCRR